jgi:PIN domain nuclease of toxin-antitoxin system
MNILLDTHALIWLAEDDPALSPQAKRVIEDPHNQTFYSIASIWELAIKLQLGKLQMSRPLAPDFRDDLERISLEPVAIEYDHVVEAGRLPLHHRDPFDRLLVAQALCENMNLASHDSALDAYGIARVW